VKANDMMNSFDFSQAPQPTLIEPANFVGPAPETGSTTTQTTGELNPTHTGLILALVVAICAIVPSWVAARRAARSSHPLRVLKSQQRDAPN
jgi:ABC-type lipoprotein release transport system permease subunit